MPYPPQIFIANNYRDARQADWLQAELEAREGTVDRIYHRIMGPDDLSVDDCRRIGACDHFLLLWSAHTEGSQWIRRTYKLAVQLHKPITVIYIDRTAIPDRLCDEGCLSYFDLKSSFEPLWWRIAGVQSLRPSPRQGNGQYTRLSPDQQGLNDEDG